MPFYEFVCGECGERFDLMRAIADRDAPAACPSCGSRRVERALPRVTASVRTSPSAPCGSGGGFG